MRRDISLPLFISLLSVLVHFTEVCDAQAPSVSRSIPGGARIGESIDVTILGGNLAGAKGLWTSFPANVELLSEPEGNGTKADQTRFRLKVLPDTPVGMGTIRAITDKGLSNPRLFMIDDFSTARLDGGSTTRDTAPLLELPSAVEGSTPKEGSHFFRISAVAGERFSVEVFARRLGSPLDPLIRLMDHQARELAFSDDSPGLNGDCRFQHRFADAGDYFLEIRDTLYGGGDAHRYRMRVGDIPLATAGIPVGVRRGAEATVRFLGTAVDGSQPRKVIVSKDDRRQWLPVPVAYANGQGSSFVHLELSDLEQILENEPNNTLDTSQVTPIPSVISGSFSVPRDRDFYRFSGKKGQRLRFVGEARRFGSPTDLFLRLLTSSGSVLAEAEDAGTREGSIDLTLPADGDYVLMAEDLHRRGSAEHAYLIKVRPFRPEFELSLASATVNVPKSGIFAATVNAVRRGYNGPIALTIVPESGSPTSAGKFAFTNATIPEGKNTALLTARIPDTLEAGTVFNLRVVGKAEINGKPYTTTADTELGLRGELGVPYPPLTLDDNAAIGIGPVFPKFFSLAVDRSTLLVPVKEAKTAEATLSAKRLHGFKGQISFAIEGAPEGVTVKVPSFDEKKAEAKVTLEGLEGLKQGSYTLKIVGQATYQHQPLSVILDSFVLRIAKLKRF